MFNITANDSVAMDSVGDMGRRNEEVEEDPSGPDRTFVQFTCMSTPTPMIMPRTTLLLITFTIVGIAAAQLAPERPATTGEHLLEVNAQWTRMDPSVLRNDGRTIRFTSEEDRIVDHLRRVQAQLSANAPTGIRSAALEQRKRLLDALDTYTDRRVFPTNDLFPGRSPVFIDAFGNACAVGHLMITSGHAELAEHISEELNLAYVHDIAIPEVAEWATTNGFTIDELAWIQPTYDHMKIRDPGVVAAIQLANGDRFEVRGPANPEAAQKLRLLRKGLVGDKVLATLPLLSGVRIIEHNGHLFIGGMPPDNDPSAALYEWNGKSLHAHDPFTGRFGIGSMSVHNGRLTIVGYAPGWDQPQERYLTEGGEWEIVPPSPAPEPGVVVPEERLP